MSAQTPVSPPDKIKIVESEDGAFYCYSNHVNLAWTGQDLRFEFNEIVNLADEVPSPFKFGIERHAVVTVTWLQAKQLAGLLEKVVSNYEKLNGKIQSIEDVKVP